MLKNNFKSIVQLLRGQQKKPSQDSWVGTSFPLAPQTFRTLGMATRCWVKVLLTLSITGSQYLPYSHPVTHSERGSYATCHILWHSTSLEKDPWLLLETRRPCQGNRKEMGLKGQAVSSIWHPNSDWLSTSETHAETRKKCAVLALIFTCMFSNSL